MAAAVRRRGWVFPVVVVLVLAAGLGWAFQPWRLFTSTRVAEAMPGSPVAPRTSAAPTAGTPTPAPTSSPTGSPTATSSPSSRASAAESPDCTCNQPPTARPSGPDGAGRTVLRRGFFIAQEHPTTGSVSVIELADGRRFLRLEDLQTRNGPALRVWLSTIPVRAASDSWSGFGDSEHRDLGPLKGNLGDQNYLIPADVDLAAMVSVTIWSGRFSVSYGAASLQR